MFIGVPVLSFLLKGSVSFFDGFWLKGFLLRLKGFFKGPLILFKLFFC